MIVIIIYDKEAAKAIHPQRLCANLNKIIHRSS